METKTPKTDAALIDNADLSEWGCGKSNYVDADFARQLEQENIAMRESFCKVLEAFDQTLHLLENAPATENMEILCSGLEKTIQQVMDNLQPFIK